MSVIPTQYEECIQYKVLRVKKQKKKYIYFLKKNCSCKVKMLHEIDMIRILTKIVQPFTKIDFYAQLF